MHAAPSIIHLCYIIPQHRVYTKVNEHSYCLKLPTPCRLVWRCFSAPYQFFPRRESCWKIVIIKI